MSTPDFFRSRLDAMIDMSHPLAVLAARLPWTQIEQVLAVKFVVLTLYSSTAGMFKLPIVSP